MTDQGLRLGDITDDIFAHQSPRDPRLVYFRSKDSGLSPLSTRLPVQHQAPAALSAVWLAYSAGKSDSYQRGYDDAKQEIREVLGL